MLIVPGRQILAPPHDDALEPVLQLVVAARRSIHVVAFSLGVSLLVDLFVQKHGEGLDVQIVLDLSETLQHYETPLVARLQAARVPTVIGVSPKDHEIVHTKLLLVDGKVAVYGSANWTHAGLLLEQNLVVIDRSTAVVTGLETVFQQVKADTAAHPQLEVLA